MILAELVRNDERVQAYLLSRNYGHQLALTCGLDYADGDAVITMDGDLQHPPELVPDLLRLWEDGNEIVQTIRLNTENVSFMKRFSSAVYYKLINIMSKVEITPGGSDFRLMDQKAVEAFRLYRERARFIRGLINTLGFKVAKVEFVAPPLLRDNQSTVCVKCCILHWMGLLLFQICHCAGPFTAACSAGFAA